MTETFDPNATPICDKEENAASAKHSYILDWHSVAKQQERRARIAEQERKKLDNENTKLSKHLVTALGMLANIYSSYGRYEDLKERIRELEQVGKHE